eukprot:maker-scaffold43_size480169-snap-gene-2.24 protein:Tk12725 transcript:maker-scaffold43_size480169-snap-gene-2.24-mRNA-1 annotation:"hypothetical protein DAPPUDRAFT_323991"
MIGRFRNALYNAIGNLEMEGGPGGRHRPRERRRRRRQRRNKAVNKLKVKYAYQRPIFLQLFTDDEIQVTADHSVRPIMVPRDIQILPWFTGYAEAINAGKSVRNEDQASFHRGVLRTRDAPTADLECEREWEIPYVYFGIFDGHAGSGCAVMAANELHQTVHKRLMSVLHHLVPGASCPSSCAGGVMWFPSRNVSVESLIIGALEAAFWDMDQQIGEDKLRYQIQGGCTVLVSLFILGQLYVANAGDSRGVLCRRNQPYPMSFDFTPVSERQRLQQLGYLKPQLLGNEYTHIDYGRRPLRKDVGSKMLYRDAHMTGWSYKEITPEDLKFPVVYGEGKRSRLLATIGVTRGFGDHDLKAQSQHGFVYIKPFLTPQPEVKVLDVEHEAITEADVMVMATDGLWDVISNEQVAEIIQNGLKLYDGAGPERQKYRYISIAQDLVMAARGKLVERNWQRNDEQSATIDDISVIVIPILAYQREWAEWLSLHPFSTPAPSVNGDASPLNPKKSESAPSASHAKEIPTPSQACPEEMIGRFRNALYNAIGNLEMEGGPGGVASSDTAPASGGGGGGSGGGGRNKAVNKLKVKYAYQRPIFLQLFTDDEIQVTADHSVRPIMVPRDIQILPWFTGYAEAINAGKSVRNEDQASFHRGVLRTRDAPTADLECEREWEIPYVYFGIFDGHAGSGCAVMAANELHQTVHKRLMSVLHHLVPGASCPSSCAGGVMWFPSRNVSVESLIIGALEAAFWDMDQQIGEDKLRYQIQGGCTVLVSLFILGQLYVANAGDSRGVLCRRNQPYPMSFDFTPVSERQRLQQLGYLKPQLLGNEYTHIDYGRRPLRKDVGSKMLYRDAHMTGWSYKEITPEDLKFPVVYGEGKRSRLLATIGVTRGFGDHDLKAQSQHGFVYIKPFLTPQPEVKVLDVEHEAITEADVMVMATDGLWDVISNEQVAEIIQNGLKLYDGAGPERQKYRYISIAQDLVMAARGKLVERNWQRNDEQSATIDDISVIVIPILAYQREWAEWLSLHPFSTPAPSVNGDASPLNPKKSESAPSASHAKEIPTPSQACPEESSPDVDDLEAEINAEIGDEAAKPKEADSLSK